MGWLAHPVAIGQIVLVVAAVTLRPLQEFGQSIKRAEHLSWPLELIWPTDTGAKLAQRTSALEGPKIGQKEKVSSPLWEGDLYAQAEPARSPEFNWSVGLSSVKFLVEKREKEEGEQFSSSLIFN